MSTILDALKKSEQERKRSNVPTLSDMPVPQESSRWPLYIIAILSLVLALVVGVLLSQWLSASNGANENTHNDRTPTYAQAAPKAPNNSVISTPATTGKPLIDDVIVNVVSYSDVPAQRFVMLNGKMYRENDFVRAGLKVQEIKPSAVVLNLRGELLSRTP